MKLYFVRHGQTDFNKNQIPQGQEIDAPLNSPGIQQVEEAGNFLATFAVDIDFIICSPLKRALQTAEILNRKLNKKIQFNEDIQEFKYGTLAGKSWPEIADLTGHEDAHERDDKILFDYQKFGGESGEDLKKRVARFVQDMKAKYPQKTILVVTHAGVIDSMHILFPQAEHPLQNERPKTANASVHEFYFA